MSTEGKAELHEMYENAKLIYYKRQKTVVVETLAQLCSNWVILARSLHLSVPDFLISAMQQ